MKLLAMLFGFSSLALIFSCDGDSKGKKKAESQKPSANAHVGSNSLSEGGSKCQWETSEEIIEKKDGQATGRKIKAWRGKCNWDLPCAKDTRSYILPATAVDSESVIALNRSSPNRLQPSRKEFGYQEGNYGYDRETNSVIFEPSVCPFQGDVVEFSFNQVILGVAKDVKEDFCVVRDPCPDSCPSSSLFKCVGIFAGKQVIRENLQVSCATTCAMKSTFLNNICGEVGTYVEGEVIPSSKDEVDAITCEKTGSSSNE